MKSRFVYFLGICGLLWTSSAMADVNLAVWTPLSGELSIAGEEIADGVKAAVQEINQDGGLLGQKVNLVVAEDMCNDSLAVSSAQMMALNTNEEYKVSAVIGPYCFNQFQRVTDTLSHAGIFQIIPTPVDGAFAENAHDGLVNMIGYRERQAQDFFDFYNESFNWFKVAMIYDKNNKDIAEATQKVFEQNGKAENLVSYDFEGEDFDYGKLAKKVLKENKTQAAFILGTAEDVSRMARELKIQKKKYVIFVNKHQVEAVFFDVMGSLADEVYFIGLPTLKDSPEFAEALVKLRLLGFEPEGLAVYGYSAVRLWQDLVKKSNSFKYEKLSQTLKTGKFNMGWGELTFSKGNPNKILSYSIYQYHDDEYTQVY